MKVSTIAILAVAGVVILGAGVYFVSSRPLVASVTLDAKGVKSLKCNNVEYLDNGEFRVERVTLKKANGEVYLGQTSGTVELDPQQQQLTRRFLWGIVQVTYSTVQNQVKLSIRTTNNSPDTIDGLLFTPLTFKFPGKVQEYDGTTPLLAHNMGDLALVRASYGSGSVVVACEDISRPLMVGFPWANDRPHNTVYPLSIHTGRVPTYPDSYPAIERPIPPGGTDQYDVTIRFAKSGTSQVKVAADLYQRFRETFPEQLKWSDRRPIGAIFLATAAPNNPSNPQGWFQNDAHLNIDTPSGKSDFRQRLLVLADSAIAIMKSMNAQGAITWDIEGEKFANAISFVGDPRMANQLAPEIADVADDYFQRFRNAGLRVGITVRPQQFTLAADGHATMTVVSDPAQLLIDKITYAKNRWGITMAYIDSNVNANAKDTNPMDPAIIQKVAAAFPDVLLIPEHSDLRYYAYSAPYKELRRGEVSTSEDVRAVYPNSFSLIYTADGPLDLYHKSLVKAVQQGDVMMYRTWYADPQNEKVKSLFSK